MGVAWSQVFPPRPPFGPQHISSLDGRVFIVTGGSDGIGLELVKMLASKGGCTIYLASRSARRMDDAVKTVQASVAPPDGVRPATFKTLVVDFSDLTTISSAASSFLANERRLDILWNNAGVAQVPPGSITVQGYEAHMGINCLGPFLFTKLLTPLIVKTAQMATPNSVRVVFTSSQIVDAAGPPGGISLEEQMPGKHPKDKARAYGASKVGNWFLASELDKRVRSHGVVSVAQNPGNLRTKAWDNIDFITKAILSPLLYGPEYGAYTELWAGLSPDVTADDGGKCALPWGGRWHPAPREELLLSLKATDEGGTALAATFWDWCDEQTKQYA